MLLDAIKDRTKWIEILEELPIELRDIYFNPDYSLFFQFIQLGLNHKNAVRLVWIVVVIVMMIIFCI